MPETTTEFVYCYRCGHHFDADKDSIDTRCPSCGSDSFLPCKGKCIEHLATASEPGRHRDDREADR